MLEKTLESPLDCKEIQPVHPKGNQSWISIGRPDAKGETPILWPPDVKNWLTGKDPDVRKDWRQEEKGTTEDKMVGWHHRLNGYEFEQAPVVGNGQGSLRAAVHGVTKSQTRLSNWTEYSYSTVLTHTQPALHSTVYYISTLLQQLNYCCLQWIAVVTSIPLSPPPIYLGSDYSLTIFAGKDWGQEEKGMTEDEMAGWHHQLNGHRFGWTLGVGDGQGGLACCGSWGRKESDTTEWLNWTELNWYLSGVVPRTRILAFKPVSASIPLVTVISLGISTWFSLG